jgi:hypothetical protein
MRGVGYALTVGGIVALSCVSMVKCARSEWKPQYAQASPEVRSWYREAELTEAAKGRFPFKNCCDHADVVRTQFRVDRASGGDEWFYLDGGTWKRIPPDIIHWGKSAPDGRPTLFIYKGAETCFFPGEGGL